MPKPAIRRMKREVREIVEWAQRYGWTFDGECDGSEHWILRYGDESVRLPATPSDYRSLANCKAKIRRVAGIPNDSGPAGKYRHEPRIERFSLDAATRDQRAAEKFGTGGDWSTETPDEAEERRKAVAARLAAYAQLQADHSAALAQLREVNPRREPALARQIARKITELQNKIEEVRCPS